MVVLNAWKGSRVDGQRWQEDISTASEELRPCDFEGEEKRKEADSVQASDMAPSFQLCFTYFNPEFAAG